MWSPWARTILHDGKDAAPLCGGEHRGRQCLGGLTSFGLAGLPALLLAKFRDMRRVMPSVPFVEEEQPIHTAFAMLWVNEHPSELLRFHGAPDTIPAIVYCAQQRQRNFNGGRLRVSQICPGLLVVWLNRWFF